MSPTPAPTASSSPRAASFGGWTLYALEGKPAYCYNLFGIRRFKVYGEARSRQRRAPDPARVRATTAAGWARAAPRRCSSTVSKVGEGRIDATVPMVFSADETTDVGSDTGTPGDRRLRHRRARPFNGRIRWVELDIDEAAEDLDHLITPEERLRVAMARQ